MSLRSAAKANTPPQTEPAAVNKRTSQDWPAAVGDHTPAGRTGCSGQAYIHKTIAADKPSRQVKSHRTSLGLWQAGGAEVLQPLGTTGPQPIVKESSLIAPVKMLPLIAEQILLGRDLPAV